MAIAPEAITSANHDTMVDHITFVAGMPIYLYLCVRECVHHEYSSFTLGIMKGTVDS